MVQLAGIMRAAPGVAFAICDFCEVAVTVPNMKNGRCFAASYGLAMAVPEEVDVQGRAGRNDMGCPVTSSGRLDPLRHEVELQQSKKLLEPWWLLCRAFLEQRQPENAFHSATSLRRTTSP